MSRGSRRRPNPRSLVQAAALSAALLAGSSPMRAAAARSESDAIPVARSYSVYVCSESADEVSLVRYGPQGLVVEKTIEVGSFPADVEGPHGLVISPDGADWYVSLAHGTPYGSVHRYRTESDEWAGDVTLGMFPATMSFSAATGLLYVANFDLHGDPQPGTVSVVEPSTLLEVARFETGVMPHGSRLSRDGSRHYSVAMMSDELIEADALRFEVSRRLRLGAESRGPVGPTWVSAPTPAGKVYVAGSKSRQIFEVDVERWEVDRTFSDTAAGPYNLAVIEGAATLVVTYKAASAVGFWDLESGREIERVQTSRSIPHAVVVTGDGAFSFVSVEGVGGEAGAVEIYDNHTRRRLGSVDVGPQAGGLALWEGR